jgi:hypothetical protein
MKNLTIKDLSLTEELDRSQLAAVRGGWTMNSPTYKFGDVYIGGDYDSSITAVQNLKQAQQVLTATGNESAFLDGVHVDSHVKQKGNNTIIG